mgnify:CR=1 FL=1
MKNANVPELNPSCEESAQWEQFPMQVDVRIHSLYTGSPVLADASVGLNGCFVIRGVKVMNSDSGPFVSMPRRKTGSGYKDVCFPSTREFLQQFHEAVLDAYQQTLMQLSQGRQENPDQEPVLVRI